MPRPTLTQDDVKRLLADPSAGARADTAEKLARDFNSGQLSAAEQSMAVNIMRIMAADAEMRVRVALSDSLKSNPDLPRDIALRLAQDVDAVALPVLSFSSVLNDDDLVAILRQGQESKQIAIAGRKGLSETVSHVVASEARMGAVAALMANETASIAEKSFTAAIDRFAAEEAVTGAMVRRGRLPMGVAELLVRLVSTNLQIQLAACHELPADLATDLVLQSRERAVVEMAWGASEADLEALVRQMHSRGRLTPSLALRAVCSGDEEFFIAALARWADIPMENAHRLVTDRGGLGLRRLVAHCKLADEFHAMARIALDVSRDLNHDGSAADRRRVSRMVIERVVTSFSHAPETDNIDYLIGRLAQETTAPVPEPV